MALCRNKKVRPFFLIVLGLATSSAVTSYGQGPQPDGNVIVQKMAERYRNAKSYQDSGVVWTTSGSAVTAVNSFKTFYVRPNRFRFEWVDADRDNDTNIVWTDGNGVYSYSHLLGLENEKDLGLAIAGATGVSRGAAHTVSTLLMSDVGGFRVTEMERISLLREESFEGEDCFVIRGFHPFGFPIDIWISKADHTLRKQSEQQEDGSFEEEIRRTVNIDAEIPRSTFQFTPPPVTERLTACLSAVIIPLGAVFCAYFARVHLQKS